jgi:heme/copper-type cytochrome/quinol oxidase subunit 2
MYIGTSIFLIALGAILKFAVTGSVEGFDIQTAGTILIVVGIIGLVISLLFAMVWNDRRRRPAAGDAVVEERSYRERV